MFPRSSFGKDEKIYYETRPGWAALHWGLIVLLLLLDVLWLVTSIALVSNPVAWIFFVVTTLAITYLFLSWRHLAYALTGRRVLRTSGGFRLDTSSLLYEQVQNLTVVSGLIRFDASPTAPPGEGAVRRRYRKTLDWKGVRDPQRTYEFIQAAFALRDYQSRTAQVQAQITASLTQNRLPCTYCGTWVDPKAIERGSPKCPSCGAPLVTSGSPTFAGPRPS